MVGSSCERGKGKWVVCSIRLLGLVEELDGLLLQQTIMIIIVFLALIKATKDSNSISYSYTIPIVPIFYIVQTAFDPSPPILQFRPNFTILEYME